MVRDGAETMEEPLPGIDTEDIPGPLRVKKSKEVVEDKDMKNADKKNNLRNG